jgi:acetyl-CoA acetyltransferase
MKIIQDAYIVAATRTPVTKAPRGAFKNAHPADLLAHCLRSVVEQAPGIDATRIDDIIIGCAMRCWLVCRNPFRRKPSTAFVPQACKPWPWPPTAFAWAKPI